MRSYSRLICEVCSHLLKLGFSCLKWEFASFPKWTCIYVSLVWTSCVNSLIVFNLVPLQDWQNPLTRFYRASYPLSKKVAFAVSYLLVYFFECVLVLRKKVNRLGASLLPRRDQNMCSSFSQVFSNPVFILIVCFWPCCGFSAASLGWCAVVTPFGWICLAASAVAFFPALLHSLSKQIS